MGGANVILIEAKPQPMVLSEYSWLSTEELLLMGLRTKWILGIESGLVYANILCLQLLNINKYTTFITLL